MIKNNYEKKRQIKLYIYTAPIKVRLLTGASYKYAHSNKTVFNNHLNCSREVSSLLKLSGRLFRTKIHVATYAISQTEMIANICHYGASHKPADCYSHEENIMANTLVYE